jgi:ribosomal protein L7/L12
MEYGSLAILVGVLLLVLISWVDTSARLKGVERKLNALIIHHGVDPTQGTLPLSDRVKELAADPGRKIEAIKAYREETGAGLAEAKKAVESFGKNN